MPCRCCRRALPATLETATSSTTAAAAPAATASTSPRVTNGVCAARCAACCVPCVQIRPHHMRGSARGRARMSWPRCPNPATLCAVLWCAPSNFQLLRMPDAVSAVARWQPHALCRLAGGHICQEPRLHYSCRLSASWPLRRQAVLFTERNSG